MSLFDFFRGQRSFRERRQRLARWHYVEPLEERLVLSAFYVSPTGDDTGAGTIAAPFATIARGMEAALPGDSVLLRAGTYRETITSVRSGTSAQPITVQSYNGEDVFVSAADVVDGPWTETVPGSGVYSTSVTGGLPTSFWTSSNPTADGSEITENDGRLVATVANESAFHTRNTRSQDSSGAWNFFVQPVTWKVRGLSINNAGTPDLPLSATNGYFTVMTGTSSGYGSDDSVNVRYKGNGQLTLLLKKDTPGNWGTNAGSVTDSGITGFDLTLGPGTPGNVDYTLTAVPSGQVVATGEWAMTQADWSDGGDGSQSYVQIFAQEGENTVTDPNQKFQLNVDSYEIIAGGPSILNDTFDDGDLSTLSGNNPLVTSTITTGYDQIFVDGEMQHEARHSNKVSIDLLESDAADVTLSNNYSMTGAAFSGMPDGFFSGARFLGRVGQGWAWQTAIVDASIGDTLHLNANSASTWWWPNQNNSSSATGIGYVYGKLDFLDADREWHIQHNVGSTDTLYLRTVGGADPTGQLVERKVRNWTVNISGHDNIVVTGLNLRGGAVLLDGTGNVLEDSDARYLSHYQTFTKGSAVDGGFTAGGGVVVRGSNNIVRGNTIYDTAGSGVVATGSDHLITRNHIHDIDYSGTYATGISLSGTGHTATFNTVHDGGRDILRPTGSGLTVMYNDLSRAGRMALDLGLIYTYGFDGLHAATGERSRIAYNWIHDNGNPDHPNIGIYLDNYTRNFIVDHNVLWDIGQTGTRQHGVRLNSPTTGNQLFHNTLIGVPSYDENTWTAFPDGNEGTFWTSANHGMDYLAQNNLVIDPATDINTVLQNVAAQDFRPKSGTAAIDPTATTGLLEWATTNGVTNVPGGFLLDMRNRNQPFFYREVTGEGVTVAGINDGFVGATPDNGAYESGVPRWTAGVDGVEAAVLTVTVDKTTLNETGEITATVTRDSGTTGSVVVNLASSDPTEATVPATVTIPDGAASATFIVSGVNDNVIDATQSVTITASESGHINGTADISVEDSLVHRMSDLTIRVQDQFGNPLPNATIDVSMTQHAFRFGTQVRHRLFGITQSEFDVLNDSQKQGLLESGSGSGLIPIWTDVLNYREAVYTNFNHIVPTNGMQWVAYNNAGPTHVDTAIAQAQNQGFGVTGHSVVWGKDGWPTPNEYRSAANPDSQVFHDALIADRLSGTGVMARYSEAGAGPTITDWDVLNEPLHETYDAQTFTNAGIYASHNHAFADVFIRAEALRPDASLAVNDYNIINSGGDAAAQQYRDLVNNLLALVVPIDVIKVQAHIARADISKADITRRLDILAETGLPIVISEFDMRDDAGQLNAAQQEQTFRDFLEASFEHPAVDGFLMWGFWDPGHWRGNGPLYDIDWNVKNEASPWFDLVRGDWMPTLADLDVDNNGEWTSSVGLINGSYQLIATHSGRSTTIDDFQLAADGQLVITIEEPAADLVASSFNVVSDHVLNGQTDVTFTVQNAGNLPATAFQTQIVWSPNAIVGDADDVVVTGSGYLFTGLGTGLSVTQTISLQLDKAALFAHAAAADVPGGVVGTNSMDVSHLFLVIDVNNQVLEDNESNNSGVGHLIDSDDITYFPWDKNANGTNEPLEALSSIQRIGTSDVASDFDGNGIVTPLEALSSIQRIGYLRNNSVLGDAPGFAHKVRGAGTEIPIAPLVTASVDAVAVQRAGHTGPDVMPKWPAASVPADDEEPDLFGLLTEVRESQAVVPRDTDEEWAIDHQFKNTAEWLSVLG